MIFRQNLLQHILSISSHAYNKHISDLILHKFQKLLRNRITHYDRIRFSVQTEQIFSILNAH